MAEHAGTSVRILQTRLRGVVLTNGKLEDIEDAAKEEERVKCFLVFRDMSVEDTLAKGQNLIGLELLSRGRRESCRLRHKQSFLALGLRSFVGQWWVACIPPPMGFGARASREPDHR